MGFYVLVEPEESSSVKLVEHIPGHPSLIIECGDSRITVQVPGRPDGERVAQEFGRMLAAAAERFAARCDARRSVLPGPRRDA